jgi:hypothetical protein
MTFTAFQPQGNTALVAASSSTSVQATQVCTGGQQGMYLSNPCTVPLYIAIGSSTVSAAQPTTAIPAAGLCIPNGMTRAFTVVGSSFGWVSAVTSAGAAAPGLLATPGQWGN